MRVLLFLLCIAASAQEGSIGGKVVNSVSGKPVSGVEVRMEQTGTGAAFSATTNDEGIFTALRMEPGVYRLSAERSGYIVSSKRAPVSLARSQKLTGIDFNLVPQGVIAGRVFDADGEPISTSVSVVQRRYVDGRKELAAATIGNIVSQTNDKGAFRVFGLAPGEYFVRVSNTLSRPIVIEPGRIVDNVTVQLTASSGQTVSGHVENLTGLTAGIGIALIEAGSNSIRTAQLNPQGDFSFTPVLPGRYTLLATMGTVQTRTQFDVPGQPALLALRLEPQVALAGSVSGAPGVRIQLGLPEVRSTLETRTLPASVPVTAEGAFKIPNVNRGRYEIQVTNIPAGFYVASARQGEVDLLSNGLTIKSPDPTAVEIVLASGAPTLTGMTTPGAKVVLVPVSKLRSLYRTSDADHEGKFSMTGLTPGEYKLFAWEEVEDTAWLDPEFLAPIEDKGTPVTLERSKEARVEVIAIH
jgi:hypothetical protein